MNQQEYNSLHVDPLFVGLTRPVTKFGLPWHVFIICIVVTPITFLWTNDIILSLLLPSVIVFITKRLCYRDPKAIDILLVRMVHFRPAAPINRMYWSMRSYMPE
jgi:type IV secretion system protein VirB3